MDLHIRVLTHSRVLPSSLRKSPIHVPLSIIDATVANFAPSETVLLYDKSRTSVTPNHLRRALEHTLDVYPHWCGRLRRIPYDKITNRYGRLALTYGTSTDPGVEFVVATATRPLSDVVPSREKRADIRTGAAWDASDFPSVQLVPDTPLSLSNLEDPSLPSFVVQVTNFSCGGLAVALKFAHPLTDAHGMALFLRDWAAASRAMISQSEIPPTSPVFDPQMLDKCGAGETDGPHPEILARAEALPCHRYDWWISAEGSPFPAKFTEIPEELRGTKHNSPGIPMPWPEWDLGAPVSHFVIHFTGPELERIWRAATRPSAPVSRQDTLLAHIWACINRARRLSDDDGLVHIDYSLGLRSRISPALPERFVGSPLLIAAISASGKVASAEDSSHLASLIRSTVAQFTPGSVADHLHAKLHEQCPQRLWQAFLGKRHLLVTSWIHTRLYDVDFGSGSPRYVEAVMPKLDGLLQLMEAAPSTKNGSDKRHWADDGVDVQLHLTTVAMTMLLRDPVLRKYSIPERSQEWLGEDPEGPM